MTAFSLPVRDIPADLEDDVKAVDSVLFVGAGEEKELSMAAATIKAAAATAALVKVKVLDNYRVCHEGKAYVGGDVLEVPDDEAHTIWRQSGWVEIVKEK